MSSALYQLERALAAERAENRELRAQIKELERRLGPERSPAGRLVVVDIKTTARKYTDLQVEASLQLSIYSYAVGMAGLADEEDLRLRFDVLTKTKEPQLHRYWTTRDRAVNLRLFRLAAEVLHAIIAGAFHPLVGWHCQGCPYQPRCWAWG